MALLLFFLGLSLAGMFEIGLTVTNTGSSPGLARHGYAGSFFTGVLAMVVATPCTAPFMGAAIGFALAQNAAVAFAVFTALALGLAAPYLLLTFHPVWMRHLPRPGAWMEVLKQATAAPIFPLRSSGWYGSLHRRPGSMRLTALLAAFLLLAIAGWILGRWPERRVASDFAVSVIVLADCNAAVRLVEISTGSGSANTAGGPKPVGSLTAARPSSNTAPQGRPVFVDFTARWCLSCQVNDRVPSSMGADVGPRRLRDSADGS